MQQLVQLNQEGTTVLMVIHLEREAGYAQRIINLLDGQIVPQVKSVKDALVYLDSRRPRAEAVHYVLGAYLLANCSKLPFGATAIILCVSDRNLFQHHNLPKSSLE